MRKLLSVLFVLFSLVSFSQKDELIIFLGKDVVSKDFSKKNIGRIIDLFVKDNNGLVTVIPDSAKKPIDVAYTPSIYFQNENGRSLYLGRYSTLDRLTNFVRNAKNVPRVAKQNVKYNIPVLRKGKATIATPIKITELSGNTEGKSDYKKEFLSYFKNYVSQFHILDSIDLPASTRLFYTDYHSYLGTNDSLYISTAIYSMFSCVEPVYKSGKPLVAHWNDRQSLFVKAILLQESKVLEQLTNLKNGDAFTPVTDTTSFTWEELGYALPQKSKAVFKNINEIKIAKNWNFKSSLANNSPVLQFAFGAPIDHYSGEVKELKTYLRLQSDSNLVGATGFVVVNTNSITMGDEELDNHIFNDYIKTQDFPNSYYKFKIVNAPKKWNVNKPQKIKLQGEFTMVDKTVSLNATGIIDLINDSTLKLHGSFQLPLNKQFGIGGPDGPSPAKDELDFQLNFLMIPTIDSQLIEDNLYSKKTVDTLPLPFFPVQKEHIKWKASNKFYKANGEFTDWKFVNLNVSNHDYEKVKAIIEIPIISINEKSKLLIKHLKKEDFFDIDKYNVATIEINGSKKIGENEYQTFANVTIKGISQKVLIFFKVKYSNVIEGSAVINREDFKIGTSAKAKGITKDIEINFAFILPQ